MKNFYKDKNQIIAWLNKFEISNYKLIPDNKYGFVVDVGGNVDLYNKKLSFIPVKFNLVIGHFFCSHNNLSDLNFSPKKVSQSFTCTNNKLVSLKGVPDFIGSYFDCSFNKLNSLEYYPQKVGSSFSCTNNPNLGIVQEMTNFNEIYQEHLKIKKIIDFNEKMNNDLIDKKTNTIKKNKI